MKYLYTVEDRTPKFMFLQIKNWFFTSLPVLTPWPYLEYDGVFTQFYRTLSITGIPFRFFYRISYRIPVSVLSVYLEAKTEDLLILLITWYGTVGTYGTYHDIVPLPTWRKVKPIPYLPSVLISISENLNIGIFFDMVICTYPAFRILIFWYYPSPRWSVPTCRYGIVGTGTYFPLFKFILPTNEANKTKYKVGTLFE